jgi:SIR2-like domain
VRQEIEQALQEARRGGAITIIPVLIDLPVPPDPEQLAQSLRPLLDRQALQLRATTWQDDVTRLLDTVERARVNPERVVPPPQPAGDDSSAVRVNAGSMSDRYRELVEAIVEGTVVPFLGPGANSSDRAERWQEVGSGYLPDADELAAYLAEKFDLATSPNQQDLAQIAQHVSVTKGDGDLYRILKMTLEANCPPGSVHLFLAGLPRMLSDRGLPERYQLIVTTNYDNALEDAFREVEEPFDLAVYMASDGGRFVHFPYDGEPALIDVGKANKYMGFPIDLVSGELTRTVIVKIHGAVDGQNGPYAWQDNYVITEDHYIDYLNHGEVNSIVPLQICSKLRYSHFAFLGYTMRDWNLRVFLHRMFGQRPLNASWAIQREPDQLDERFWRKIGADCIAMPLGDFVREIELALPAQAPS